MTNTRKHQVLTALLLMGLCATTFAAEAQPPTPELKFITSTKKAKWMGSGPITPKYEASFHIRGHLSLRMDKSEMKEFILKTSIGHTISAQQKNFLAKTQDASKVKYGSPTNTYSYYRLYAVSQEDAKIMTRALV